MHWFDKDQNYIASCDFNGNNYVITKQNIFDQPFSLTSFDKNLFYLYDNKIKTLSIDRKASIDDQNINRLIQTDNGNIIRYYSQLSQPENVVNTCKCKQLCLCIPIGGMLELDSKCICENIQNQSTKTGYNTTTATYTAATAKSTSNISITYNLTTVTSTTTVASTSKITTLYNASTTTTSATFSTSATSATSATSTTSINSTSNYTIYITNSVDNNHVTYSPIQVSHLIANFTIKILSIVIFSIIFLSVVIGIKMKPPKWLLESVVNVTNKYAFKFRRKSDNPIMDQSSITTVDSNIDIDNNNEIVLSDFNGTKSSRLYHLNQV